MLFWLTSFASLQILYRAYIFLLYFCRAGVMFSIPKKDILKFRIRTIETLYKKILPEQSAKVNIVFMYKAYCIFIFLSAFCRMAAPLQQSLLPILGPSLQVSIQFLLKQITNQAYRLSLWPPLALNFLLHRFHILDFFEHHSHCTNWQLPP